MITDTETMKATLESMRETQQIADNIHAAVSTGELTPSEAVEILDAVIDIPFSERVPDSPDERGAVMGESGIG